MTDNVKKLIAAGFERLDFMVLDSAGIGAGATGSVSSGAAGAACGRLLGVQTAEAKVGNAETVNIPGDDGNQGAFIFGPAEIPPFDIIVGVQDLSADAAFQTTTVFDEGSVSWGVLDPGLPVYVDVALIAVSRAKSKVSGSDGVANYSGILVPKCNLVPLGRVTFQGRAGAGFRYTVQPTRADAYPWGRTLKDSDQGAQNGVIFPWSAPNPITMHRWTGDGATTAFTVGENFATAAVAECRVYVNTTIKLTGVTPSLGTKNVTITAAPALNDKVLAYYQYTK
jgi:hypothetical protein